MFVYDALLEALKTGNTAIGCAEFKERYEDMCKIIPDTEKSKLMIEFEVRIIDYVVPYLVDKFSLTTLMLVM